MPSAEPRPAGNSGQPLSEETQKGGGLGPPQQDQRWDCSFLQLPAMSLGSTSLPGGSELETHKMDLGTHP